MESIAFYIQWCLDHLNYWTITLLMTIESSFIPFPSEIVVTPAAYKAAEGDLNVILVVIFATLGANIGAIINYYLAYFVGRPIIYRFAGSRWGKLCLLDVEKIKKAEAYFDKHGAISTFVGRLLPAIRQLISIPAGLAKMKLSTFLLYTTLGAGIWNMILAAAGYYFQKIMPLQELMTKVTEYNEIFKFIVFGAIGLIIIYFIYLAISHKSNRETV